MNDTKLRADDTTCPLRLQRRLTIKSEAIYHLNVISKGKCMEQLSVKEQEIEPSHLIHVKDGAT